MPTSSKNGPRSRGRTGVAFEKARARVLNANQICAHPECGQFIDLGLRWPDPLSGTVDHIIPVSDLEWDDPLNWDVSNLQPMHLVCNQRLGNKKKPKQKHPTSRNWRD